MPNPFVARKAKRSVRRAGLEIVPWDPAAERAGAVARSGVWALGTTLAVSAGLAATASVGTVAGWLLLTGALVVSANPLVRHRTRSRRHGRLAVWALDARWARMVVGAADEATRLRTLADHAPDGPVAEHLTFLAEQAENYVHALHGAATQATARGGQNTARGPTHRGGGPDDRELEAEAAGIVEQLAELTRAAERLRQAQRRHLEHSPLSELIDRTERITESIEAQAEHHRLGWTNGVP